MRPLNKLEVIAFVSGFCLLTFELVAARLLAPSIGSSTYVWTSVIGVIIAALSLGYWLGGRVADVRQSQTDVAWLLLASAVGVGLAHLLYVPLTQWVIMAFGDSRLQALIAATILFAPSSFLLGALAPYLVRLNLKSIKHAGATVANLGALNSIGGIVGTFVTGFIFFGFIGAQMTLLLVVLLLVGSSWLLAWRDQSWLRLATSLAAIAVVLPVPATGAVADIDTPSARYSIVEGHYNNRPFRGVMTGSSAIQSGMYLDNSGDLSFWYTREMARQTIAKKPSRILMLGGGAFTLPQYLARELPDSQIDVVEIDPGLKGVSEKYFAYKNPRNVRLIFDDARSYIEKANKQYDVVLVDVYGDGQIPFSLTTLNYTKSLARLVPNDGVVIANVIAGLSGGACQELLSVIDAAYRSQWPSARYSTESGGHSIRSNIVVRYSRAVEDIKDTAALDRPQNKPHTDDFAPIERMYQACENQKA